MRNQDRINLAKKIVVSGTDTYVCIAPVGTAETTAAWQIKKISISGGTTTITWADSDDLFNNVASNPAGLNYG